MKVCKNTYFYISVKQFGWFVNTQNVSSNLADKKLQHELSNKIQRRTD